VNKRWLDPGVWDVLRDLTLPGSLQVLMASPGSNSIPRLGNNMKVLSSRGGMSLTDSRKVKRWQQFVIDAKKDCFVRTVGQAFR
jgi:hypothetical protein